MRGLINRFKLQSKPKVDSNQIARGVFQSSMNELKMRIDVVLALSDEIPTGLATNKANVARLQKAAQDEADANSFPKAMKQVELLLGELNTAYPAATKFTSDKARFLKDYPPLQPRTTDVVVTWGKKLSPALLKAQKTIKELDEKIGTETGVHNYVKAAELMGTLSSKLGEAEGLKSQFDKDKVKHELDAPLAEDLISKLCKHSNWKDVDPKLDALMDQRDKGRTSANKYDYGAALPRWTKIISDAPKVSAEADKWQKFRPAEKTAKGLIAEVKDNYKKSAAQAKYDDMKAALVDAQDKASKQKFDQAHVKLMEITTLYGEAMTLANTAFLAEMATAKLDKLELHSRATVIAPDIERLRKIAASAETNMKNGLHKAAVKMIWDVYNSYKSLKKIADASAAYEVARKKAEEQVKELTDLKQPKIAEGLAELKLKLAAGIKEGADDVRKYSDAQVLFDEIATEHPLLKKLAEEHAAVGSEQETVLKQDPDKASAALRAKHKALSEKAEEIVKEIKTPLDTAKGKLDEADRLIAEEKKKTEQPQGTEQKK